ncbi:MAG: hypothetical protein IJL38_00260 [Bacteroidales bacterium]|nr:hypothetical protein [Bacteroidales bacterium]
MNTNEQMPQNYPFNEWTWQYLQKSKKALEKRSSVSKEEAIAQAKSMREIVEKQMNKNKEN